MDSSQQTPANLGEYQLRCQFRYYTRSVLCAAHIGYHHKQRLQVATQFQQSEPLQGALADYLFACWHENIDGGLSALAHFGSTLPSYTYRAFEKYLNQGYRLPSISPLATRWSVLVTPSMRVASHRLYVGQDDAKWLSSQAVDELLAARASNDLAQLTSAQMAYLQHCLACQDRVGFMKTWFALAKADWDFDETWIACKQQLIEKTLDT